MGSCRAKNAPANELEGGGLILPMRDMATFLSLLE